MAVYYNEIDPFAAAWLRNLISAGHIPAGDVDERSIANVQPMDLKDYAQCHFFAGIGGWSHALRLAGWPDDRPIWTGSCPCQPFSVAGKGKGKADERHLWPVFHQLIAQCRPPVVMGEQVAGKAGYDWFDGVAADLEREDYAARAIDIPACAVDAPHIRQRLYWVALADVDRRQPGTERRDDGQVRGVSEAQRQSKHCASLSWGGREVNSNMVNADCAGQREHGRAISIFEKQPSAERAGCGAFNMADANGGGCDGRQKTSQRGEERGVAAERAGFWSDHEWLTGADGKTRRVKSGVRLLVDGVPNRVGRLRGYGNAIVPPLAAEVIKAFMDA